MFDFEDMDVCGMFSNDDDGSGMTVLGCVYEGFTYTISPV